MHSHPRFSSLPIQSLLLLLCVSHSLALTCYSTTPPAQAPDATDCTYILDRLPALTINGNAQVNMNNITILQPLPGFRDKPKTAFQLPAHFRHGSCGIAIRANVPGGGPNPPQRGAVLPAGGSVVGDTCIPVRFIGGTLTAFWSVAKSAGEDLVKQCVNNNQQAGIEWGTFLPRQGPPYPNAYPSYPAAARPSGYTGGTNDDEAGPSNYGGGANDDEAGPSNYYGGANDDEAGPSNYGGGANDDEAGPSNYQNASLYPRGVGSTLRPQEAGRMLEPRGAGQSTQGGAVEALWGVWIAGHDMPRDSLANVYDIP